MRRYAFDHVIFNQCLHNTWIVRDSVSVMTWVCMTVTGTSTVRGTILVVGTCENGDQGEGKIESRKYLDGY